MAGGRCCAGDWPRDVVSHGGLRRPSIGTPLDLLYVCYKFSVERYFSIHENIMALRGWHVHDRGATDLGVTTGARSGQARPLIRGNNSRMWPDLVGSRWEAGWASAAAQVARRRWRYIVALAQNVRNALR